MPDDRTSPDRARLAREALAEAKADARARGESARPWADDPSGDPSAPGTRRPRPPRTRLAGPRRDDPQPLAAAIDGLLDDQGWRTGGVGSVFGRWAQIVGPELAAHTRPDGFADGELAVIADSTAWATQVRLLARSWCRAERRARPRHGAPGEGARPGPAAPARRLAGPGQQGTGRHVRLAGQDGPGCRRSQVK